MIHALRRWWLKRQMADLYDAAGLRYWVGLDALLEELDRRRQPRQWQWIEPRRQRQLLKYIELRRQLDQLNS
jgi:hypothetical protein